MKLTRDKSIRCRLSSEEYELVKKQAEKEQKTISAYMRYHLLQNVQPESAVNAMLNRNLSDLVYQIRKIGNNINQIAFRVNSGVVRDPELAQAMDKILELEELMHREMKNLRLLVLKQNDSREKRAN